jgi:hypothetical protein
MDPGAHCGARNCIGGVSKWSRAVDNRLDPAKRAIEGGCVVNGRVTADDIGLRKCRECQRVSGDRNGRYLTAQKLGNNEAPRMTSGTKNRRYRLCCRTDAFHFGSSKMA